MTRKRRKYHGYTITTFQVHGGVRVHWDRFENKGRRYRSLCLRAGGQEVGLNHGDNWQKLKEGEQVWPATLTWFWNIDDGLLPWGPFATEAEAAQNALDRIDETGAWGRRKHDAA